MYKKHTSYLLLRYFKMIQTLAAGYMTIGIDSFPEERLYNVHTMRLPRAYFRFTTGFNQCLYAADNKNNDKKRLLFSAKYTQQ